MEPLSSIAGLRGVRVARLERLRSRPERDLDNRSLAARRSLFHYWWSAFLLLAGLTAAWSVATPLAASPDEPVQVLRAVSIVRGQWLGPTPGGDSHSPYTLVRVPGTYTQDPACFAFKPDVSAACQRLPSPSARTVTAATYVGRYPPLYFLLVGWPSLFTSQYLGFYLMRIASAVVNAAFMALAFATARRWSASPVLHTALAIAITPMSFFLASVVNPSGLEITAAVAAWTAVVVWAREFADRPPPALVAVVGISTIVTISMRGISLLWPFFILAAVLPALWGRIRPLQLIRRKDVAAWAAAVLVVAVLDLIWVLEAKALNFLSTGTKPPAHGIEKLLQESIRLFPSWIQQQIGVFGWLDTGSPAITQAVWLAAGSAIVLIAVMLLDRRQVASVVSVVALSIAFPIVLASATAPRVGFPEQGRYFLPLSVGVPIVAAGFFPAGRSARDLTRRLRIAVGGLLALGNAAAFWWTLHRYVVGTSGPVFGTSGVANVWHPPLPWQALDLVFAALCVLYAWYTTRRVAPDLASGRTPPAGPPGEYTVSGDNGQS